MDNIISHRRVSVSYSPGDRTVGSEGAHVGNGSILLDGCPRRSCQFIATSQGEADLLCAHSIISDRAVLVFVSMTGRTKSALRAPLVCTAPLALQGGQQTLLEGGYQKEGVLWGRRQAVLGGTSEPYDRHSGPPVSPDIGALPLRPDIGRRVEFVLGRDTRFFALDSDRPPGTPEQKHV